VTGNLYGDIISDIAAEVSGSVGLAGSANIGTEYAVFEAIHGSAPDIAGQGIANPSGLLNSALMMLQHLGLGTYAETIEKAWAYTIEQGIHTADIFREGFSKRKVSTHEFAEAVAANLGKAPAKMKLMFEGVSKTPAMNLNQASKSLQTLGEGKRTLVGTDVFLFEPKLNAQELGAKLSKATANSGLNCELLFLSNRGIVVWPNGFEGTRCIDNWRCRFVALNPEKGITNQDVLKLLTRVEETGFDTIKTENLYEFDGVPGFSKGQGQ
jgi:isocitrate dehydrogenase